mgnify:CR=1 FL=1
MKKKVNFYHKNPYPTLHVKKLQSLRKKYFCLNYSFLLFIFCVELGHVILPLRFWYFIIDSFDKVPLRLNEQTSVNVKNIVLQKIWFGILAIPSKK